MGISVGYNRLLSRSKLAHTNRVRRDSIVSEKGGKTSLVPMRGMNAGNGSIILHTQIKGTAFGVGKSHDTIDYCVIGQSGPIALELNGKRLCLWDVLHRQSFVLPRRY